MPRGWADRGATGGSVAPRSTRPYHLLRCGGPATYPMKRQPIKRQPISFRPTATQLAWLKDQRQRRGINLSALVILALERAMAADSVADDNSQQGSVNGR